MTPKAPDKALTVQDVDFDDPEQLAGFDDQMERREDERLAMAMERLRAVGLRNEKGERAVGLPLPPDMREDSD